MSKHVEDWADELMDRIRAGEIKLRRMEQHRDRLLARGAERITTLEARVVWLESENEVCRNLGQRYVDRAEAAEAKVERVKALAAEMDRMGYLAILEKLQAALQEKDE